MATPTSTTSKPWYLRVVLSKSGVWQPSKTEYEQLTLHPSLVQALKTQAAAQRVQPEDLLVRYIKQGLVAKLGLPLPERGYDETIEIVHAEGMPDLKLRTIRCSCSSSDAPGRECPVHGEAV